MAAAPHPLAAAALLVLAPALVAVSAHPTGLPSAEDRVTARDPGFPAFPGFPGFYNPFYPQLPQLPAVPQLPPFPFFYPPILPYNLLDKPNGGLAGGVSSYNLGGSSSSGGGSSGGSSSGSVTTYGLQSHNGQVTGGGLIVAANPNGTFTTYEIILRPINVTAIPGAAPTPVVSAPEVAPEAVAEVVPEAMTEAMTEAKKVANLASAAAAPAAEVAKLHAKTARRETEDGEGEPKGEDEAGEEKPEGGQEEATGEEEAPPEGESEVEEAGRSLAEAGEDYHLEDVEEAVPADEQA